MPGAHQLHFLLVTFPAQGQINPTINLANRFAGTTGAHITISTSISAHRKMFPNLTPVDQEVSDGGPISYFPFSDGCDDGVYDDLRQFLPQFNTLGSKNLSSIIDKLGSRGRRVDYVIYTFMQPWAADVAREHGIPSAQYWVQPATVFAIFHAAFHGYEDLISAHHDDPLFTVELPGLPPMRMRDLPHFLTTPDPSKDANYAFFNSIKEAFLTLDREVSRSERKPKVLVSTFDELEVDALSAVNYVDLIAVGSILQSTPKENKDKSASADTTAKSSSGLNLFKPDTKAYMQWLDSKPEKSVVYVSFGSLAVLKKEEMEEILKGLKASGRPYLWVVRKDCRVEGGVEFEELEADNNAMIVAWCSQVGVLTHPSVGCFVTHCGWNSTLESLLYGVPTVGLPQMFDQTTNAMLIEKVWGTGVRVEVNDDGVVEGEELRRCLDVVMGEGERGMTIRKKAEMWKGKVAEAAGEGGSSDRNLRAFVNEIAREGVLGGGDKAGNPCSSPLAPKFLRASILPKSLWVRQWM